MQEFKYQVIGELDGNTILSIPTDQVDSFQYVDPHSNGDTVEDMKWATRITKCSYPTLLKILDQPFIKKQLDVENGGCVRYSTGHGSPWKFWTDEFSEFVKQHPQYFIKGRF